MIKSHAIGECAELLFLAFLAKHNITSAIPFGNQGGWDCLVEHKDGWKRYQIKAVRYRLRQSKNILMSVECRRSMKRNKERRIYKPGDFDFLVAVDTDRNLFWKIPASVAMSKTELALHDEDQYFWK